MLFLRLLLGYRLLNRKIVVGLEFACSTDELSDEDQKWADGIRKEIEEIIGAKLDGLNIDPDYNFSDENCIYGESNERSEKLLGIFCQRFGRNYVEGVEFGDNFVSAAGEENQIGEYKVELIGHWYIKLKY